MCFNIQAESKSFKRAYCLAIDGVRTKQILFLPMLARKLTLEESYRYDNLSEEEFNRIRSEPEVMDLIDKERCAFHTNKAKANPTTHVKVRLLSS